MCLQLLQVYCILHARMCRQPPQSWSSVALELVLCKVQCSCTEQQCKTLHLTSVVKGTPSARMTGTRSRTGRSQSGMPAGHPAASQQQSEEQHGLTQQQSHFDISQWVVNMGTVVLQRAQQPSAHLRALEQVVQDGGHLWRRVQEHETLADVHPTRLLCLSAQLHQQVENLQHQHKIMAGWSCSLGVRSMIQPKLGRDASSPQKVTRSGARPCCT